MISMKRHSSLSKLQRIASGLASLALFATAMTVALPLHAADSDRAVKQRVAPVYPELAKRMHIAGMVRVAATVAPDGSVSATKTVSGNHMLAGAAEDAVHKWKFVSAPEESTVEVDINFAAAQ
ncbi:MAG TPA: energy transducer TonB [Acidobacteriaceae bacterium]|nr:energy transducer TonB [Acidobacteriaceae bacterium]